MAGIEIDVDDSVETGFLVELVQPGVIQNNKVWKRTLYEVGSGENDYLLNGTLKLEVNKAGSFEFDILPSHGCYSALRRYVEYVSVKDGDDILFYGRILSMNLSFSGIKHVVCEGLMANLLDCPMFDPDAPSTDKLFTISGTPAAMYQKAIKAYRNRVRQDITFGETPSGTMDITLEDIDVSSGTSVGDFITSELVEAYGGFLEMDYSEKPNGDIVGYLRWKPDPSMSGYSVSTINQTVEFAVNMLDLSAECDDDEIMTGIIPMWEDSNNEKKWATIQVEDVDNGDFAEPQLIYKPYVVGPSGGLTAVGIKVVDLPGKNMTQEKALEYGSNYQTKYCSNYITSAGSDVIFDSYTVRAIDLHYAGVDSKDKIKLYSKVNIKCSPHNVNTELTCSEVEISIDNPMNSSYTFSVYRPKASSNDKVLTRQIKRKRI